MADTKLVKARGEHWVCSVLAGRGWSVALTRNGLERTDILASHAASNRMIEVQVKAASYMTNPNWRVNKNAQQLAKSDREWFVFVALAENPWDTNRGFVVPRDHVAAAAWINHQHWLTDPTVPPGQRNAVAPEPDIHDQRNVQTSGFPGTHRTGTACRTIWIRCSPMRSPAQGAFTQNRGGSRRSFAGGRCAVRAR